MPTLPKTFRFNSKPAKKVSHKATYDAAYRKLRKQVIAEEPLCRTCLENGWFIPGEEVDHIKSLADGGTHTRDNLQHLCKEHHREKSAKEMRRQRGLL